MQSDLLIQPPPFLSLQPPHQSPKQPRSSVALAFDNLSNLLNSYTPNTDNLDKSLFSASSPSGNYHYGPRTAGPGPDASSGLNQLFEDASSSSGQHAYRSHLQSYHPSRHSDPVSNDDAIPPRTLPQSADAPRPVSSSPSAAETHLPSFPPPHSAPHHQDTFAPSEPSIEPNMDRYSMANLTDRYLRGPDKATLGHYPHHDQRRMSEPSTHGPVYNGHSTPAVSIVGSGRYQQLQHEFTPVHSSPRSYESYVSSNLHRTLSSGATHDQSASPWKEEEQSIALPSYTTTGFEEPISPLEATFSGGEGSPGLALAGVGAYPTYTDDYGPSPPGTGTSTSSSVLGNRSLVSQKSHHQQHSGSSGSACGTPNSKQYSFVALPGNAVKKRPRRRYDEIERLYQCSWPGCTKAYGTLNHLNAHVTMQKHGLKRSPNEFKELRKQWRKAKKEEAEARALRAAATHDQLHMSRGSFDLQSYDMHHQQQLQIARIDRYGQHMGQNGDYRHGQADEYGLPTSREGMFARRDRFSAFEPNYSLVPTQPLQYPSAEPSSVVMNRLPPDSTLLTPLPGYEPDSVANGGSDVYLGGSYELYSNDARPSSRHDSLNGYPIDRRHSLYSGDERPRSGHADIRPRDGYGQI